MIKKIFLFCVCACLAAGSAYSQQSREELQKEKKQLEKEIDDLNSALNSTRKNKKQSLSQLAIVQRKIATREKLINNINKDVQHLDDDIYSKELERNHLKKELDTLKMNYAKSIVFAYKNRSSYEYLNFLFSASDFNDALKRMTYLKSYRRYRETQAQTILQTQDLLQGKIVSLNTSISEHMQVLQTQNKQLKTLEDDKKEKDQVVKQLKAQENDYTAQLRKREKDRQQLNRSIEAIIRRELAEAERKARLKPDATAAKTSPARPSSNNEPVTGMVSKGAGGNREYNVFDSTPEGREMSINFENNKGRLPWPVSGGFISGHFGIEAVQGTKLRETNDGIFISTPVGSAVRCVADGDVVSVFDLGDYQSVLVKHGKYFTVYNKLSDVSVSNGQKVKAGTLIGKAALDFDGDGKIEFRVMAEGKGGKNQFVDPERWLKSR